MYFTRLKSWQQNALITASSIVIFFLVSELGLRLVGFGVPSFYQLDPLLGHSLRPNATGWWTQEGRSFVSVNGDGLRGRKYSKKKADGTFRVAILGDSFMEAVQLPLESSFCAVLEQELKKHTHPTNTRVEVINFGVSGYGTDQEYLMLRSRVWEYHPDLVLLAFFIGNDIRNNHRSLESSVLSGKFKPYFIFKNGQLVLDDSFARSESFRWRRSYFGSGLYFVLDHSRFLQLIKNAVTRVKIGPSGRSDQGSGGGELGLDSSVFLPPIEQSWIEAWQVTEGLLESMRDEIAAKNTAFIVVNIPASMQVHPNIATRSELVKALGVTDLDYPDIRIRTFCESNHISVISLAPLFLKHAQDNSEHLYGFTNNRLGFGHWNSKGHELAARLVAGKIHKDIFSRSDSAP